MAIGRRVRVARSRSRARARRAVVPIRASATAELSPGAGGALPAQASGGGYTVRSPTARASRCGPTSRSRSIAWRRAAREAGVFLDRHERLPLRRRAGAPVRRPSGPEVGRSAGREPAPLRAPSSTSGRRRRTRWLAANAPRFGFVQRYAGSRGTAATRRNPGSSSVGFGARGGDGAATRAVQSFVPRAVRAADHPRRPALERVGAAACRSALRRVGLQPVRPLTRRRRGHRAVHARHRRRDGPRRPVRPDAAINAQAHLMRDLLAASARCRWRSPPTTPARARSPAAAASRRSRRRRATSPASSACWAAPATSPPARSRFASCR